MSLDLDIQIHNLYQDIETHQEPITLDEIRTARVPVVDGRTPTGRLALRRGWVVALTTAAAVLLVGLVVFLAQQQSSDPPVINQPDPIPTTVPETSPTTVPETAQTTLPPPVVVPAGALSWQLANFGADAEVFLDATSGALFDGGDRFVFVHGLGDAVSTSFDGVTWTTRSLPELAGNFNGIVGVWEDTLLTVHSSGAIQGEEFVEDSWTLSVLLSDGTVNQHVFDANVDAAAIGPAGIVVGTSSNIHDDDIVLNVLGADFADNLFQTDLRDGVLYAETNDGRTAEIVLADHGYDPNDLDSRVDGWYSADGQQWIPIPDFPGDGFPGYLVGTREGFVGIAGGVAWHSPDGQTWQNLGRLDFFAGGTPLRWKDGALVIDGAANGQTGEQKSKKYRYVSARGIEVLPVPSGGATLPDEVPFPVTATGGLGIVTVELHAGEVLFSSDGANWSTTSLPPDMAKANSWTGWFSAGGAATDQAVLMLLWNDETGEQTPSWWLGTPQ
jgi:hypothetical protein